MRQATRAGRISGKFRILVLLAALAAPAALAPQHAQAQDATVKTLPREPLAIVSGNARHAFSVEVARKPDDQARGLMYRRTLAPDAGMLFVYPSPRIITMWMENTLIPLDMLFVAPDGRIVSIHERAVPRSRAVISSRLPAIAVVEVPGGTAARLKLKPGDRVINRAFGG